MARVASDRPVPPGWWVVRTLRSGTLLDDPPNWRDDVEDPSDFAVAQAQSVLAHEARRRLGEHAVLALREKLGGSRRTIEGKFSGEYRLQERDLVSWCEVIGVQPAELIAHIPGLPPRWRAVAGLTRTAPGVVSISAPAQPLWGEVAWPEAMSGVAAALDSAAEAGRAQLLREDWLALFLSSAIVQHGANGSHLYREPDGPPWHLFARHGSRTAALASLWLPRAVTPATDWPERVRTLHSVLLTAAVAPYDDVVVAVGVASDVLVQLTGWQLDLAVAPLGSLVHPLASELWRLEADAPEERYEFSLVARAPWRLGTVLALRRSELEG